MWWFCWISLLSCVNFILFRPTKKWIDSFLNLYHFPRWYYLFLYFSYVLQGVRVLYLTCVLRVFYLLHFSYRLRVFYLLYFFHIYNMLYFVSGFFIYNENIKYNWNINGYFIIFTVKSNLIKWYHFAIFHNTTTIFIYIHETLFH